MASSANRDPVSAHEGVLGTCAVPTTAISLTTPNLGTAGVGVVLLTAAATVGTYVSRCEVAVVASTTTAAAMRFWHCDTTALGAYAGNETHFQIVGEILIPVTTLATGSWSKRFECPLEYTLPPDHRIVVTVNALPGGTLTIEAYGGLL